MEDLARNLKLTPQQKIEELQKAKKSKDLIVLEELIE